MKRLAVFISHPIQYQVPLYRLLSQEAELELTVYFYSRRGVERYFDKQFGTSVQWDTDLVSGYQNIFLKNLSWFSGFGFFSFFNLGILPAVFAGKYSAVLINSWSYLSDWLVFLGAWLTRTPIFLRTENPYSQEILKPSWKRGVKWLLFGKLVFPLVKAFLYIGQENRDFYRYYGVSEDRLIFAPYCVDNESFRREAERLSAQKAQLKKDLGLNPAEVVILAGGKLTDKKRPLDVLTAYESIKSDNKALVFLGEGALRQELEARVKSRNLPNVFITGFVNQQEIARFYALADVFVLASGMGETWGLMANEAMNFGLPIVVSDLVGCARDLVHSGENGFVFPLGKTAVLAELLETLLRDPNLRQSFSRASLALIKKYDYNTVKAGILSACQSLVR